MDKKQIHLEIRLFYWHHSYLEPLGKDILGVEILKIDIGNNRSCSLLYYSNIGGLKILKLLFFLPGIVWGKLPKKDETQSK